MVCLRVINIDNSVVFCVLLIMRLRGLQYEVSQYY
jgi:hypothetical protein